MNRNFLDERCFRHAAREAVGRCPECRRYFCRECLVEHERRVICSTCLDRLVTQKAQSPSRWIGFSLAGHLLLGLFVGWCFFYLLGSILLKTPASVHEGTVWKGSVFETQ